MKLQKGYLFLCVVFVLALHGVGFLAARAEEQKFVTVDGESFSFADLRGSVSVLHFFASWCGECILEAPSVNQLSSALKSGEVKIVGIAIDDTPLAAKAFKERLRIEYPVVIDQERILKQRFGVKSVPMTIILDKSGKPAAISDRLSGKKSSRIVGPRDWSDRAIKEELEALTQGSEPADRVQTSW